MKRLQPVLAAALTGLALTRAQEPQTAPLLSELMQNIEYATLLQSVKLTPDQLGALAEAQTKWLDAAAVPPDVVDAMQQVCLQVVAGASRDEAFRKLGEFQQEVNKAQQKVGQTERTLVEELKELLKPEQREALLFFHSPVRHLSGMIQTIKRMRKVPQAWERFRPQAIRGLTQFASQPGGRAAPAEEIGEWLDAVREMTDEEFAEAEPTLAKDWAEALAPEAMKRLKDPKQQEQRLQGTCHRLLTYPGGLDVVQAALEAGEPEPEKPEGE